MRGDRKNMKARNQLCGKSLLRKRMSKAGDRRTNGFISQRHLAEDIQATWLVGVSLYLLSLWGTI